MPIDVSEVVWDYDLMQAFTILRSRGSWTSGIWGSVTAQVQGYGVISVAEPRALEMEPQGDVVHGAMFFWSAEPIYATNVNVAPGQSSDILVWNGKNYRVLSVNQYLDYGYYRAMAVRMQPE